MSDIVTAADTTAAREWFEQAERDGMIRRGSRKDYPLVQLLARHRIAAEIATTSLEATRIAKLEDAQPYLVWSNEHRAWWAPDRCGYTRRIERAGRYSREEAISISGIRGSGWPLEGNPYEIAIPERDAIEQFTPRSLTKDTSHVG